MKELALLPDPAIAAHQQTIIELHLMLMPHLVRVEFAHGCNRVNLLHCPLLAHVTPSHRRLPHLRAEIPTANLGTPDHRGGRIFVRSETATSG